MMVTDIYIYPIGRLFDVDEVTAYLEVQPNTVRDAVDQTTFMIGWNAEAVEEAIEARRVDPTRFSTDMILVGVFAERIGIHYRTTEVAQARHFAEWLQARYEVRYQDEEFNDLTAYCKENLDYLFGTHEPHPSPGRALAMDTHGHFTVSDDPQGVIAVALMVATTTVNAPRALVALVPEGEGLRVHGVGSIRHVTEREELPAPFDQDPKLDPDGDELWVLFRGPDGTHSGHALITGPELRDLVRRALAARALAERTKS
jgi:hypothetical protein